MLSDEMLMILRLLTNFVAYENIIITTSAISISLAYDIYWRNGTTAIVIITPVSGFDRIIEISIKMPNMTGIYAGCKKYVITPNKIPIIADINVYSLPLIVLLGLSFSSGIEKNERSILLTALLDSTALATDSDEKSIGKEHIRITIGTMIAELPFSLLPLSVIEI